MRDMIMGKQPSDWDFTTSAKPAEIKAVFDSTFDTGIKHGTITVVLNKRNYEVTTYRIDGVYTDNRRPDGVSFTSDITEDLKRRDFTMNSIAYNAEVGFYDPFDGRGDIGRKIIRAVGSPSERFGEDALRMLRAVRFSAQLDFCIEDATLRAVEECAELIRNISAERIRDELQKLLMSNGTRRLPVLAESGLLRFVLPEVAAGRLGFYAAAMEGLVPPDGKTPAEVFSLLLMDLGERGAKDVMERLKFDNKTIRETVLYVKYINMPLENTPYFIRKHVGVCAGVGRADAFRRVLALKAAIAVASGGDVSGGVASEYAKMCRELDGIESRGDCVCLKQLAVTGDDLKALGISNGMEIGRTLQQLLEAVLHEPGLNTRDGLLSAITRLK